MNIKPRTKQILVKPQEKESSQSEFGIVTPDNVEKETKAIGTIIAIGSGIDDVKVNDRVIYGAFAGEQISLKDSNEEVDYILLFDEDVLAVIE